MFGHLKHLSRTYIKPTNSFCFKKWVTILFQLKQLDISVRAESRAFINYHEIEITR